jgi:hypothetical protein
MFYPAKTGDAPFRILNSTFKNLGGDTRGMEIRKPLNAVSVGYSIYWLTSLRGAHRSRESLTRGREGDDG